MKLKILLLLLLVSIFIYPDNIHAQDIQESEETMLLDDEETVSEVNIGTEQDNTFNTDELNTFTFMDFVRMLLILLFVIICIYGVFFVLKKAGAAGFDDNDLINIISSKNIAPNKNIHVIEVGNQMFMLGSSENTLNLISEITDKETIDRFRIVKSEIKPPAHKTFYSYMLDVMHGGKKSSRKNDNSVNDINSTDFIKKQRGRMEKL